MAIQNEKLFSEFPPVSTPEWESKIKEDLKGADYEKKLIWRTLEGIAVKPYYRLEDTESLGTTGALPGSFPYIRGNRTDGNQWQVRQDVAVYRLGAAEANRVAIDALAKGATSIGFVFDDDFEIVESDFAKLLEGIDLAKVELNFVARHGIPAVLPLLKSVVLARGVEPSVIQGSISLDPIGFMMLRGNFCKSPDEVFNTIAKKVEEVSVLFPNLKVLASNGFLFHNSGATAVQELGFSLSVANEYLAQLTERGLLIDNLAPRVKFNLGVGTNYFMEIAKIRAARLLWAKIVEQYKPANAENAQLYVHSVTSIWDKTVYDPYVNVLRTTTEAMSAAVGGTDSLTVNPFDISYKTSDEISERIARNTQLILKEESNLDKVVDPAAGSYYIETLTVSLAEAAWKLFLEVENMGGFLAAFKDGFVQKQIETTAQTRNMNIATRRDTFLGTNQFPNQNEKMASQIEAGYTPYLPLKETVEAFAKPLTPYRGTMAFEELRLKTERLDKTPKVFLLTFGNLAMRKARAMFSSNFFACAGFEVLDNAGFKLIEDGIAAALESKAEIVVLCSSDDEYAQIVPPAFDALNNKAIVVLAGYPTALVEQFKTMGLKNYIHIKSNVLETLQGFQKEVLGI